MMKTLTVQFNEAVSDYIAAMVDHLQVCTEKDEFQESFQDFQEVIRPLLDPARKDKGMDVLRRLFRQGYTMMLLESNQIDTLESWSVAKEEFGVVIKDGDKVLGILCDSELSW